MGSKYYLIAVFILFASCASAQNATIKGRVSDGKSHEPLPGAYVYLDGLNKGASTDAFGNFEINKLTTGNYKIKVKYIGFGEFEKEVNVTDNQNFILNVTLTETQESLKAVNVFGTLNESNESSSRKSEKNAGNITNVLSARAMERSPDINAANALSRVSAVTIQRNSGSDEGYAIIRGMEPRYNNTLINGAKVTSPDPVSRFISLSVVPSDLLDHIDVSKTLTPEMEADAIGGTVNLVFKEAPDHEYFKANASLGYSAIFFNQKFDNFSKTVIQQKSPTERFGAGYQAQPNDFSRANLDFQQKNAPVTSLASFTYGKRFFNNKLGFIIADSYQNQYYGTKSEFNLAIADTRPGGNYQPVISDVANRTYSTQQLNNGLSGQLDYKFNDKNTIKLSNVFLYTYLAQTRLSIDTSIFGGNGGRIGPGTGTVYNDNRSYIQRQYVENLKLDGKHIISKHFLFDWSGVYSNSTSNNPDRADISINHKIQPDFTSTPNYFNNITRLWQKNGNKDYTGFANLSYKTGLGEDNALELRVGGVYRHSTRFNNQNTYILRATTQADGTKQPFTDIYSANWIVYNQTGTDVSDLSNYTAYENLAEGYGEFKLSFGNKLDAIGGVRIEDTKQGYVSHPVVPTIQSSADKTYRDFLPSLQLKYKLNNISNFRLAYFKSIARPALFELVPTILPGTTYDTQGNPSVQHTVADNFDIRYELFPKNEEQFFIGAFYKNIVNPIEFGIISTSGLSQGQPLLKPQNFGTAKVAGAEVVYSRYFGNVGVSGNYTYTYSNINAPKIVPDAVSPTNGTVYKNQSRPLQGQTDNILNLSLLYKDDKHKAFIQLAYTYTGKTLAYIYYDYGSDYYQQPQSFLALSGEKQVSRHFTLTGKVNNLLNTPTTIKINNLVQSKDLYNVSFNVGFRYSL